MEQDWKSKISVEIFRWLDRLLRLALLFIKADRF